ncbi:FAD binding domain-containing protein [Aspergillus parasiticus]|uniref:FAD binding domain-containing protein n=1 Tax=Aspergillus parasiticus TaxID=5067 RepID=A0A5N6E148_ASPPA|nr:FAD binding domain-containing protein [Aspergillus parasiticus]
MSETVRTDVLIIGAGPAGLIAAAWMAQTGVQAMLIDQKSHHTKCGRADGLESRTLEILDSFGLADRVWAEANHTVEIALWGATVDGKLQRQSVTANSKPGWSRFHESTLGQAKVEEYLMEYVRGRDSVDVRREMAPTSLEIDYDMIDDHSTFPIRMNLENVAPKLKSHFNGMKSHGSDTSSEPHSDDSGYAGVGTVVEAKYLVGCDGAHSWVRKQLGLRLEGESSSDSWGVLDIIPLTNFPDIRKRFIVKSKYGTLMMIPRERKLVRVYVELPANVAMRYREEQDGEILMGQVEKIMQPYTMRTKHIDWSTIYTVGQRVCRKIGLHNRIFLAGDAIHTHSPKAGQGMNVSMQDTFNLGWKLASVIRGALYPQILETYQQERLPVAERLIALDKRICRGMCSRRNADGETFHGAFDEDHKRALEEENSSASGLAVIYQPNLLVTPVAHHQATNLRIGGRIPSMLIINQSDAQPRHLQHILPSTGEWSLIIFGGDIADPHQMQRLSHLAVTLGHPESIIQRLNNQASAKRRDSAFVRIYLIHCAERLSIELHDLPAVFRPWTEDNGVDYSRVWVDEKAYHHAGGGQLYNSFGISPEGCMVLLRPDQHLSFLSDMDDGKGLERFLTSITPEESRNRVTFQDL